MSINEQHDDLIIDNGFPVLNNFRSILSKRGKKEEAEDDKIPDPLPRFPFASYANALSMPSYSHRESFLNDCSLVFTARTRDDSEGYSSGSTFFLPCLMKPRCALEALAQTIFRAHVVGLEWEPRGVADGKDPENITEVEVKRKLLFDPERSGAEWWTLVLDTPSNGTSERCDKSDDDNEEDDEVGMHFDADYGLEEQLPNYMLHPRVGTITYLSETGVPTLILDKRSPPPSDTEKQSLGGNVGKAWLSHPSFGKHVAFDGRLLHGAPSEYFPAVANKERILQSGDANEPKTKKIKVGENVHRKNGNALSGKRITFLVNIWLNHCPIDAEVLEDDVVDKLTTIWENIQENSEEKSNLKEGDSFIPPFQWNIRDVSVPDKLNKTAKLVPASAKSKDPAGTMDVVICNRHVSMLFGATMEDFHNASKLAADEGSMQIKMEPGVLSLEVGRCASSEDEDDDGEDED